MKKITVIGAALLMAASLSVYGQGTVQVDNSANTGVFNSHGGAAFTGTSGSPIYDSAVTQNGLIFTLDPLAQAGNNGYTAGSQLMGADFSWALFGGSTAGNVTSFIVGDTGGAIAGDNVNWGDIQLQSGTGQNVTGSTAGSAVFLELFVWEGSTFADYASALAGNDFAADSGVFSNPSGGIVGGNPVAAAPLSGMPDMQLAVVPEPTTLALAGLGGAALLAFRRKKA